MSWYRSIGRGAQYLVKAPYFDILPHFVHMYKYVLCTTWCARSNNGRTDKWLLVWLMTRCQMAGGTFWLLFNPPSPSLIPCGPWRLRISALYPSDPVQHQ